MGIITKDELLARRAPTAEDRRAIDAYRDEAEREHERYERTLAEVRKARRLTQVQLAETMGTAQGDVSRIERQGDLYLSTLARYVSAMGGRLELTARFDDGERVELAIGDVTADPS